jgi:hypothetical protein
MVDGANFSQPGLWDGSARTPSPETLSGRLRIATADSLPFSLAVDGLSLSGVLELKGRF